MLIDIEIKRLRDREEEEARDREEEAGSIYSIVYIYRKGLGTITGGNQSYPMEH